MGFDLDALIDTAVMEGQLSSGVAPSVLMRRAEAGGGSARRVVILATSVEVERRQHNTQWTPEEEAFLEESLGFLSFEEIGERLGRTPTAIKIRWTRKGMDAPSKQLGEVVATKVSRRMGVCGKLIIRLIDEGRMPGRVIPGGRNIHVITEKELRRWVTRPENWIYFKVERIRDRSLKRLVMLAQERWPDEWWTPGQMADYHNLKDTSTINNAIRRGDLPAVRWQNWSILKSDAVAFTVRPGSGRNEILDWSVAGDAFMVLARAVGLTPGFIDELRGEPKTTKRADWRLRNLMKNGQVPLLIKRFGLNVQYDGHFLWADWRDHADRFPGLVRAVGRFHAGARLSVRDRSVLRGILWSWAQWHAETDEQRDLANRLKYMAWSTPKNLRTAYDELLGWGIDPLGDGTMVKKVCNDHWDVQLHPDAVALRPVRVMGEEMRLYTATTFPDGPWRGCELTLRRCMAFGYLVEESDLIIDVLDENGDIIQDYSVSRDGFEYLRRVLQFRVEEA